MTLPHLSRRDLRLGSGLVMFGYITIHFIDHALGLWSIAVAERALGWSVAIWHSLPGTLLLYGAAAAHVWLALEAVYQKRTLRMPPTHAVRIAMGFAMPVMLIGHVVATRAASDLHALAPTYHRIVWALWMSDGEGRQLAMQAPGWVHGCMGLQFAFGRRAAWQRLRFVLFGAAVLLPVLAGLGFLAMGRELAAMAADPAWQNAARAAQPAQMTELGRLRDGMLAGYFVLIAAAFGARELRGWVERVRRQLVTIGYPQRTVQVPRGWSVLEASRGFGIAHLSMCGGQARCSTCRVRVIDGAAELPPPGEMELRTLQRIRAAPDVRLACQLRPTAGVVLEPLLDPHTAKSYDEAMDGQIVERELALLFVKLVRWTGDSNRLLSPHDRVFALNRFLALAGDAIAAAGGQHGRYDGEGAFATFAGQGDRASAVRQALAAARTIERGLGGADGLNAKLQREIGLAAEVAVALHVGPVAIGPVGYGSDRPPRPMGETLRHGRTLRDLAESAGQPFAISQAAATAAGWDLEAMAWQVADGSDRSPGPTYALLPGVRPER